ncbi:ABC transporter domain-containing protein [Trichoderma breve]|uniref:ABC transporter domain-containing protein n=1 Tax=Trichoderma breve TaxID=2034170 RepID=A0A9W9B3Z5_9HYPO|nr:ABC transporter domain-containing protein [Trichoderma breve]KAJ4855595.1 ABC transporter domain-containing protein [Trichoderma breve]
MATQSQAPKRDDLNLQGPVLGESVATDPLLYSISPVQLWIGRLVSRVCKAKTLEDGWLPVFSCASAHLRGVAAPLYAKRPAAALSFLMQKETGGMLFCGAILEALSAAATIGSPLLLHKLLEKPHDAPLAWGLVIVTLAATVFGRAKDQLCRVHYAWMELMLRAAIFEKSIKLSPQARVEYPPERIINMSSVDADNLANYMLKVHDVWSAPLQIVGIGALTVTIMGPTALFGFALVLVVFISQSWANKGMRNSQRAYIMTNDGRLGALRELLYGIGSVKALGYEMVFRKRISQFRAKQAGALRNYLVLCFGYFTAVNQAVSGFAAGVAFLAYFLMGHELTAAVVFPALTYFGMLYQPISNASLAFTRQFATWPSFSRVQVFLTADESELAEDTNSEQEALVTFKEASFSHPVSDPNSSSASTGLEVGNLTLPSRRLTIVVGPTGSGKSTFLRAILGDVTTTSGSCSVRGSVSYSSQDAWVFSGTLQENIVFAAPFDAARYHTVMSACGLYQDFPRDNTSIGESGNNLSGGQRARIALARALYSESDILLLDDPFAAVDAKTRALLFDTIRALEKTVVLVTLHHSYIPRSDNVVVIEDKKIAWAGTSSEFAATTELCEKYLQSADTPDSESDFSDESEENLSTDDKAPPEVAVTSVGESSSPDEDVFEEEDRAEGTVSFAALKFYAACAGGLLDVIAIGALVCLLTGAKTMSSYWFVWWIDDAFHLQGSQYLGAFIGLTVSPGFIAALLGIVLVFSSLRASDTIHSTIVDNVLSAPIAYFSRQPVGRILNRFTHDVMSMDVFIMNSVDGIIAAGSALIAAIALVAAAAPITLAAAIPSVLIAGWYQLQFAVAAREVQRSASILHSPVLSIVSEALRGMSSIRAFGARDFMSRKHDRALDTYMSAVICRKSLDTWVTFRAELSTILLLLVTAMLVVYTDQDSSVGLSGTQAGLALSNATAISQSIYLFTWSITELQIEMNSIERLKKYYEGIPREPNHSNDAAPKPPVDFNSIEYKNVSVIYKRRQNPALDSVNLVLSRGERVGIIGRTGSGKSTLISTLARLVDVTSGSILIGGADISELDPKKLRTDLVCTLSQQPLLFKGTFRENLDPAGRHSDEKLLETLKICQLSPSLIGSTEDLSKELTSEASDISAGQRQLLCAARVLLMEPQILLVDEASANVDFTAEAALQDALGALPAETTVVSVAHRAATLAWMDRIITVDAGRIVESGVPEDLLRQQDSHFYQAIARDGEGAIRSALAAARKHNRR